MHQDAVLWVRLVSLPDELHRPLHLLDDILVRSVVPREFSINARLAFAFVVLLPLPSGIVVLVGLVSYVEYVRDASPHGQLLAVVGVARRPQKEPRENLTRMRILVAVAISNPDLLLATLADESLRLGIGVDGIEVDSFDLRAVLVVHVLLPALHVRQQRAHPPAPGRGALAARLRRQRLRLCLRPRRRGSWLRLRGAAPLPLALPLGRPGRWRSGGLRRGFHG
mmetsp:Transcript_50060/g.131900  ORF Transcript_50060/g.131900 Transcript_50060/m.131900 type:complete len:224 (+) Transcript_50060:250-921(+)